MNKHLIALLVAILAVGTFGLEEALSQQVPNVARGIQAPTAGIDTQPPRVGRPVATQVPGEIVSRDAFDALVELVRTQTVAVQSLGRELERLKRQVEVLETQRNQ